VLVYSPEGAKKKLLEKFPYMPQSRFRCRRDKKSSIIAHFSI